MTDPFPEKSDVSLSEPTSVSEESDVSLSEPSSGSEGSGVSLSEPVPDSVEADPDSRPDFVPEGPGEKAAGIFQANVKSSPY